MRTCSSFKCSSSVKLFSSHVIKITFLQKGGKLNLLGSVRSTLTEFRYIYLWTYLLHVVDYQHSFLLIEFCGQLFQVIVEKAGKSDIPDIDKKKLVLLKHFTLFKPFCRLEYRHLHFILFKQLAVGVVKVVLQACMNHYHCALLLSCVL